MFVFLNILYTVIHVLVILFNLFGWIWKRMRRWHIWVVAITWSSWLILGLKYGLGYCFLTDWHWEVKRRLGEQDLPNSFVQYFFQEIGILIPDAITDILTVTMFIIASFMSIYFNFFKK